MDPGLDLDAFKGFPMYVGLDLASRSDLNAAAFLVEVGETLYAVGKYWLGDACQRLKDDRFADSFLGWQRDGWLEFTSGGFINYKAILRRVLGTLEGHDVIGVALDDYQANLMATEIEEAGYPTFIVRKNAKSLTPATEDLIGRVSDPKLFRHDGNPVTAWCAGNVVGHWDNNDNVLPKKEKPGSKANIDGIDALILANAIRLDHGAGVLGVPDKARNKPNPYLTRGLLGSTTA
jgi:phage terminase large subunit-like protein